MPITSPPAGIFKAYDIRGLYGEEMDEATAHLIGRGFARVLARLRDKETSELRVGLGHDMRLTAPEMSAAVRRGLVEEGVAVLDAGRIATEMSYFLVGSRDLDGGAMVTASHNPKAYTGVKLIREGALALSGDAGIQDVRAEIEDGMPEAPGGGSRHLSRACDFRDPRGRARSVLHVPAAHLFCAGKRGPAHNNGRRVALRACDRLASSVRQICRGAHSIHHRWLLLP
jgi:phosphomannomutase